MSRIEEQEFNLEFGKRLEFQRLARKMTMEYLGALLGVRGQQIHKYELGENRITPHKLYQCAQIFNVPVGYFFGEDGERKSYDKSVVHIAAEINTLPPDVKKTIYALTRMVNKSIEEKEVHSEEQAA